MTLFTTRAILRGNCTNTSSTDFGSPNKRSSVASKWPKIIITALYIVQRTDIFGVKTTMKHSWHLAYFGDEDLCELDIYLTIATSCKPMYALWFLNTTRRKRKASNLHRIRNVTRQYGRTTVGRASNLSSKKFCQNLVKCLSKKDDYTCASLTIFNPFVISFIRANFMKKIQSIRVHVLLVHQ